MTITAQGTKMKTKRYFWDTSITSLSTGFPSIDTSKKMKGFFFFAISSLLNSEMHFSVSVYSEKLNKYNTFISDM